ncbi:rhodanese-like domain-containing protein [Pseudonocardia sp. CA-107938]|uniref:rhodanese-like domain-containing protein n=1 Tax=Pseudonocardia sp. CA-107938 TaxID=3240021 RepID=UPI003D8AD718
MNDAAIAFFAARLAYQTDVSDTAAAGRTVTVVDFRSRAAWDQGHVPGAVHLPTAEIPDRADAVLDRTRPVVTYCWGPGCNGATRAALALARLGFDVREMIGGIEYWIREGLPVETRDGTVTADPDPLTVPCGC